MLTALVVVVIDELFNCRYEFLVSIKRIEVVHLTFQNAPEAFHRTIIDATTNTGHTLLHFLFVQFCLEQFACILESSVTMKQWMCVRILLDCQIKGIKYKLVARQQKRQAAADADAIDNLERLHQLREKGILTDEEFAELKEKMKARI